jgi:hypothetical protein
VMTHCSRSPIERPWYRTQITTSQSSLLSLIDSSV